MTIDYHQKYCLECVHFDLDLGSEDYSEDTPGSPATIGCLEAHWHLWRDDYYDSYKTRICMARTCPDFEPDPELAKIGKGESK